jgi:hypothetical protein
MVSQGLHRSVLDQHILIIDVFPEGLQPPDVARIPKGVEQGAL